VAQEIAPKQSHCFSEKYLVACEFCDMWQETGLQMEGDEIIIRCKGCGSFLLRLKEIKDDNRSKGTLSPK
jgi:uncharacterized Zn finger protein